MTEHAERAARYSDLFGDKPEHHTSDCAYCPICATISVVRNTKPEVLEHLGTAAREFLAAAVILLEEASQLLGDETPAHDETMHQQHADLAGKIRHLHRD